MATLREKFYAGVMGFPVNHSRSPQIFSDLARILGYPLDYRRIEVRPENWEMSVTTIQQLQLFQGWNVTLPYKERFFARVDHLSPEAQAIGAVNVIRLARDGSLWGYNTDVFGVLKTLEEQKVRVQGASAVIFGAGGAALAVSYVLGKLRASEVWLVNRTLFRARTQAMRLRKLFPRTVFHSVEALPQRLDIPPRLFVNATPLGMSGFPKKSLLPKRVEGEALALDLVYHPEKTPFLQAAQKQGLSAVNGLDMLLWQALASWEIWVGKIPQIQKVKNQLKQGLKS